MQKIELESGSVGSLDENIGIDGIVIIEYSVCGDNDQDGSSNRGCSKKYN